MTPEDEADLREIVVRLQAMQEIQHARLLALGKCLDEFGIGVGLQLRGGQTTSDFVKQEAVRYVGEKLRYYADEDMVLASCMKQLLDDYEKSKTELRVPARILCLDDEPAPLLAYKSILGHWGYEVLTTQSSREALEIMSKQHIDLLIQDIARPDINGIDFYEIMKSNERLSHIPVVICSGANCERFLKQYQDAAAVIAKPFEPKHLVDLVRKALGSART